MTGGEVAAVTVGFAVAFALWIFMFRLDRDDIWPRTWVAAAVLSAYAIVASAMVGELDGLLGPVSLVELAIGAAVGAAWLVATHAGANVIGRIIPSFRAQLADLYGLAGRDTARRMVGPLVAMAIAEELLFRSLIQGRAGLAIALLAYVAVQLVERKWALMLAALMGGAVWGVLFEWRAGLVAPIVAHALWTLTLTLVWPLPRAEPEPRRAPLRS